MKIDLHTHTVYGSGCSHIDPSALVEQAKRVRLDGVCITEHNQLWVPERIERLSRKHNFVVIGGVEVLTGCGEILVFGLHESVRWVRYAEDLRKIAALIPLFPPHQIAIFSLTYSYLLSICLKNFPASILTLTLAVTLAVAL